MPKIRNIPWPRVLAESAIIVASILLALWVDAWRSDRQERVEELEILAGLQEELHGLVQEFEENLSYVDAIRDATLRITNASIDLDPDISDIEIDRLYVDMNWYTRASFASAPLLESLVNSAEIDAISNGQLRRHLGVFIVSLAGFRLEVSRESDYFNRTLMPYVQEHVNMAQVYVLEFRYPGSPERVYPAYNITEPKSISSNRDALRSREFQNILLHRLTTLTNVLDWHEEIRPQLTHLTTLIDTELELLTNQ